MIEGSGKIFLRLFEWVAGRVASRLTLAAAVWLVAGLGVSAGVVWVFSWLAEEVLEGETRSFDTAVLLWIHTNFPPWLDEPMRLVTALGYYWSVGALLVVCCALFLRRGLRFQAAMLAVSTLGSAVLTTVLKAAFQRPRPDIIDSGYEAGFFSFPSGHATVAVGFYGALALIVALRLGGAARWFVVALGIAVILLIGLSRLYFGVHYPTDILAGYLAAPLWLVFVGVLYVFWIPVRGLKVVGRRGRRGMEKLPPGC